ncbi:MAG TPA: hypothetical protein VKA48_09160 [Gammaproteobacteria bacterium]|nr:hypothetical protein [Gammaproteobacteria bacterium]
MEKYTSLPAPRFRLRAVLSLALAGVLMAGPAAAQMAQSGGQGGGSGSTGLTKQEKQELRQAQQKVQKLRQRIGKVQQAAMKNNPDLQKQREDLKGLLKDKMQESGATPDKDLARMKEIRGKLSGKKNDLPKEKRQALMKEFQQKAQGFQKAQKAALQDPEVQKARDKFRNDLMTAMKDEEPKVDQLIQDLHQARKEFRKLLSQRFSGHGMGSSGSGGAQKAE